jgi:hypothetical protein
MKFQFTALWIGLLALALAWAGCSKKSSIDTAAFAKLFSSAQPAVQQRVEKVTAAIKAADHGEAKHGPHVLREDLSLSPEQQKAIWQLMKKLKW